MKARVFAVVAALALALALPATAQQAAPLPWPTKPVRIITPLPVGSGPDSVLRLVGDKLSKVWGQQVLIENRPGGNGFIAIGAAKRESPDGYTFVQMDDAHMSLQPHLFKKIPYDVAKDFDPVGSFFRTYFFVAVPASSSWKDMKDLIAAAKAKPDDVTFGSWAIGSPGHVGMAMLEAATGTQMRHVTYKEISQLYVAVANNEVAWAFGSAASSGNLYRAGKLKYIAVAAPQRMNGYESIPTMAEAGGPKGVEAKSWVGLFAPRGTPAPIVARINQDLAKVLAEPEVKERFATYGYAPIAWTPDAMTKQREADFARYGDIVKRANISVD